MQRLADRVSAVFVPVVIALVVVDARRLARARRRRHCRVYRCGCRPDHRVPLRTRPRNSHRLDGRDRSRRTTRHPHQRSRGSRVDPHDRHRGSRQDRNGHNRSHAARRDRRCGGGGRRFRAPNGRCTRRRFGTSDRARAIADGAREQVGTLPKVEEFSNREGLGVEGRVDGISVLLGAPSCSQTAVSRCRPPCKSPRHRPKTMVERRCSPAGTVRCVRSSWSPTR